MEVGMNAIYDAIKKKRGELVELPLDVLVISEFNTRQAFIDEEHVKELAAMIAEYGFYPDRAIQVNVIRNAAGEVIAERLVGGAHRYLGAKLAGRSTIDCRLYYGLTDEEECFLDSLDNKIDEKRKRVHFFAEAEHYRYLLESKGWSQRQIAQTKGVSRSTVQWKLQIAALPEQVKDIIRGGHHGGHLTERHLREVIKLKTIGHIILIIKEIFLRGEAADQEKGDGTIVPMRHQEILNRVGELLEMESRGEVAPEVAEMVAMCPPDPPESPSEASADCPLPAVTMRKESCAAEVARVPDEEEAFREELRQERIEEQKSKGPLGVASEERSTGAMKFDVVPRWLKWSRLPVALKNGRLWELYEELIKYELRYKYNPQRQKTDNGYFYIETRENTAEGVYKHLGRPLNLKAGTVQKKLRKLEKDGLLEMPTSPLQPIPRFRIHWEHLKELYDRDAWHIPFEEGGLEDAPFSFTGPIEPTPHHTIWLRGGLVKEGVDQMGERAKQGLKALGAAPRLQAKLFKEYLPELLVRSLEELPQAIERYEEQNKKKVKNKLEFLLGILKTAPVCS
jgi:ParB/RepB/Spo0J family partition protein